MKFSEPVAQRLREMGWSESRHTDTTEVIRYLVEHGYQVHRLAEQVLTNLGGLRFDMPQGGVSWLEFDTKGAICFITTDDVRRVEEIVGERVSPIGDGGGFVILLAETGRAYLLHDEWFCLIGASSLGDLLHFAFTADRSTTEEIPVGEQE